MTSNNSDCLSLSVSKSGYGKQNSKLHTRVYHVQGWFKAHIKYIYSNSMKQAAYVCVAILATQW